MAISILVVVAQWQVTQLPAKTLATSVIFAGRAVAISPPVTEAFGNRFEFIELGKHRAAFTHGDVVRRVKAERSNIAKSADHLAAVGGAQCVAAVFYQPQLVFLAQGRDDIEVEGVACRVRQHDGFCLGANCGLDLAGINVLREAVHINKHGHRAKLVEASLDGWLTTRVTFQGSAFR